MRAIYKSNETHNAWFDDLSYILEDRDSDNREDSVSVNYAIATDTPTEMEINHSNIIILSAVLLWGCGYQPLLNKENQKFTISIILSSMNNTTHPNQHMYTHKHATAHAQKQTTHNTTQRSKARHVRTTRAL